MSFNQSLNALKNYRGNMEGKPKWLNSKKC